ncbi:hypothetical protein GMA19_01525 [Paenibacillus polymyxa E681]|uniref:hypothetical protein n=1 Tax=Paenibacillus polymyxa TaxID=1406 RepID=UPI0001E317A5|nr:hypothetical protein [Paenibacillus polymyxa]ADM69355.1 hypothetical protein PPE_01516 [Paenibacillus polymyxa E681]QNV56364.1 hypothetical protein GE561_01525 [Paenibacillus polymyxa E681]QNV61201.1 hypothetical protein GMA19_01525 [Paenibacillus polymyxa E681]
MTITLDNQEVVNLTTTEIPYHFDLTIERLCYFLDISPKATIIIDLMKFHLKTIDRLNEFVERLMFETSGSAPELSLLAKMRKEDIDSYSYADKATFVYDYYRDKQSALEMLFQEPMKAVKIRRFKTDNPVLIYDAYIKKGKYSSSLTVALSI